MVKEAAITSLTEKLRKDGKLNKKLDRTIRAFANNRKLSRKRLNELKEVYFEVLEREENCSSIPDYDEYLALNELFFVCLQRFSKSDETSLILMDRARETYFGKYFLSKKAKISNIQRAIEITLRAYSPSEKIVQEVLSDWKEMIHYEDAKYTNGRLAEYEALIISLHMAREGLQTKGLNNKISSLKAREIYNKERNR
ncbi:MAG: hypothetical protein ACFNM5_00380 [Candidatus Saccharibacteria bacterium]